MSMHALEIDEDEAMSFLGNKNGENGSARKRPTTKTNGTVGTTTTAARLLLQQKWILVILVAALLISAKFIYDGQSGGGGGTGPTPSGGGARPTKGGGGSTVPTRGSSTFLPDDLGNINTMISKFQAKKKEFIAKLQVDYGPQTFQKIFEPSINGTTYSRGRLAFRPVSEGAPSWDRLKRKVMMRLLEVQAAFARRRGLGELEEQILEKGDYSHYRLPRREGYVPFIWATGGHSAACGHGNLYNQSYTAFMERGARDIFAAVGIEFIGRNYAMGGTSSGPEVAMCLDPIFGQDIDVLSWDFGMTDGNMAERIAMYFMRAGMNPGRPACVAMHHGNQKGRITAVEQVTEMGLAGFILDDDMFKHMIGALPDTAAGLSSQEIEDMPEYVRYFRCGSQVEKGDPGCDDHKFTTSICGTRKYKTSWHPGWKWHAMAGNLMAFFMIEILDDALQEIAASSMSTDQLFATLKAVEDADYKAFMASEPAPIAVEKFAIPDEVDKKLIFMGPNFCHSAKLPSESRYYGVLTEQPTKTGYDNYDIGITQKFANANFTKNVGPMRLLYDEHQRQKCEVPLNIDHKDWFYVHFQEGWKSLTVPNDSEIQMYGDGKPPRLKGVIAVCFMICDWGKCPQGNLRRDEFHLGMGQMQVNGKKVVNMTKADHCDFLKNKNGYFWEPNDEGRFEIRAKAMEPDTFYRIGAFVIW